MSRFVFVVLCAVLFAFVLARPAEEQKPDINVATIVTTTTPATILKQVDVKSPDGSYNSSYETSNGIKVENIGFMKKILVPATETADGQLVQEHEEMILVQTGSYSYPGPDGSIITLRYMADENGFQPQGDHLPVAPQ